LLHASAAQAPRLALASPSAGIVRSVAMSILCCFQTEGAAPVETVDAAAKTDQAATVDAAAKIDPVETVDAAAKTDQVETVDAAAKTDQAKQEWEVHVDGAAELGLEVVPGAGHSLRVRRVKKQGAVHKWNEANKSAEVQCNDMIMSVNGKVGDLLEVIKAEKGKMVLTIRRSSE